MNYIGFNTYDTANGPGIRVSLFVSGCTLHCKGCFNQESWDFNAGKPFLFEDYRNLFKALDNEYIAGLSILGGDPFEEPNKPTVHGIVQEFRNKFKDTKTIWIWTGRKYDNLIKDIFSAAIIELCDVIVDGPFIEHLKVNPAEHKYFGSSNQRVIYLKKESIS